MYCNGPGEHYIDLACPYGKTNSPLEFCPPVALFAKSVTRRYSEKYGCPAPKLGTHVDDIFGGLPNDLDYHNACNFRQYICRTGNELTLKFNMNPEKTPLPAKSQVMLGCLYDSVSRRVKTARAKQKKYLKRIEHMLGVSSARVEDIWQLHGNLYYAAGVTPFGRPFLAHITNATKGLDKNGKVCIPPLMKMSLRLWKIILTSNRGSSFDFVLNRLPQCDTDIFVDASKAWGIGGCCGTDYFKYSWGQLGSFGADIISRMELLACLVAIECFREKIYGRLVILYSDSTNAVSWLKKSRASNVIGARYLAIWELRKYKSACKVSPRWIPGEQNTSADALSRGKTPRWLCQRGTQQFCNLGKLSWRIANAELSWREIL